MNTSNHCEWIDILESLYNGVLRRSCKVVTIRFGHTSPIKFGNLYSNRPFDNKPIVASYCERQSKID